MKTPAPEPGEIERRIDVEARRLTNAYSGIDDTIQSEIETLALYNDFKRCILMGISLAAEIKAEKPSDEGLEAAAEKHGFGNIGYHSFKAGAAHQAPISRAEGFREAVEYLKRETNTYSFVYYLEQEGIRLGILKGDGE